MNYHTAEHYFAGARGVIVVVVLLSTELVESNDSAISNPPRNTMDLMPLATGNGDPMHA